MTHISSSVPKNSYIFQVLFFITHNVVFCLLKFITNSTLHFSTASDRQPTWLTLQEIQRSRRIAIQNAFFLSFYTFFVLESGKEILTLNIFPHKNPRVDAALHRAISLLRHSTLFFRHIEPSPEAYPLQQTSAGNFISPSRANAAPAKSGFVNRLNTFLSATLTTLYKDLVRSWM